MSKSRLAFPRSDNWGNFEYEHRVLDALADLFWFQSPCSAAVYLKDEHTVLISHNQNLPKIHLDLYNNYTELTINSLQNPEFLLSIRLLSNPTFINYIKNQKRAEEKAAQANNIDGYKSPWNDFLEHYKIVKDSIFQKKCIENEDINKINELRPLYLKVILKNNYLLNLDTEVAENLFRPLQDCYKIDYFCTKVWKGNIPKIIIVENNQLLHAENNLFHLLDKNKDIYYGTSKLSCGFCHPQLGIDNKNHRGTHGKIDEWKTKDEGDDNLKASIGISLAGSTEEFETLNGKLYFEVEYIPKQERRLSTDLFEIDVIVNLGDIKIYD